MAELILNPSQLTSITSAVNLMVSTLGEALVTGVDIDTAADVDVALLVLDAMDLLVQSRGFSWNREDMMSLPLDTDSKAPLPAQTLRVARAYYGSGTGPFRVTQRGTFLYDRDNHTFIFEAAPVVDLIVRLSWDELPQVARMYITYLAVAEFHARMQERTILLQVTDRTSKLALTVLEQHEDEVGDSNSIQDNISVRSALHGNRGLRRNRTGA